MSLPRIVESRSRCDAFATTVIMHTTYKYLLLYKKKYPVDFDDELKIGDVRYNNVTKITI